MGQAHNIYAINDRNLNILEKQLLDVSNYRYVPL